MGIGVRCQVSGIRLKNEKSRFSDYTKYRGKPYYFKKIRLKMLDFLVKKLARH